MHTSTLLPTPDEPEQPKAVRDAINDVLNRGAINARGRMIDDDLWVIDFERVISDHELVFL